jgi:ABC-2 type transport system permease protein
VTYFLKQVLFSFKLQATYRIAWVAGLATNLFFGLLRAAVLIALYNGQPEVNGLSIGAALTYVALTQGIIAFIYIFGTADVINSVYSGSIATDLLKPVPFFTYWLAQDLGRSLMNFFSRGLMLMLFFSLFFPVSLPQSLPHLLVIMLSLGLSWLVTFAYRFLVNLSAFWTPDARGVGRIFFILPQFLSGFFMPLRLLPDWFQKAANFTPFPSLINTPMEVYNGILKGTDLLQALFIQLLWFIALAALAQLVMRRGIRKLIIQGG